MKTNSETRSPSFSPTDDETFFRRALAAYFRAGGTDQPSGNYGGVIEHDGLRYVVLMNVNGVLAVYRITQRELLRRLRRWPKALDDNCPTN